MSEIKVNSVVNSTGDNDSGLDLSTNDQVIIKTANTTAMTVDASQNVTFANRYPKVALIADVKSDGTDGGTFSSGAWHDRDLNTEIYDPDNIVTISSNQFTIGSGTYIIEWDCAFFDVSMNQTRLYDVTGGASLQSGLSMYGNPPDNGYGIASGSAQVTITSNNTYKIQHRCLATKANTGFGLSSGFGEDEQFVRVKITKLK